MVYGELGNFPMEIFSSAGVCLTSLQALKICYSNILAGLHEKAVCVASELKVTAIMLGTLLPKAFGMQNQWS